QRVIINGDDVSDHIRSEDVSMAASAVSAYPEVREFLLGLQRSMADSGNVIMDGRDIGTVVLPKADLKVFLTASKEERARRRYEELKGKGIDADFDTVLKDLSIRDHNDSNRKTAPLTPAEDAVIVDTTGKELCASVETLYTLVKEKLDL
ncbi:MAG: (d)CMP kinase, partial [Oscillospiraceae bacterium]|nr:(d)CMP kinase [Oscillospiraceae bacterium]